MKCHGIYLHNFIPHHTPSHEADSGSAFQFISSFLACLSNVNSHLRHVLSSVQTPCDLCVSRGVGGQVQCAVMSCAGDKCEHMNIQIMNAPLCALYCRIL